MFGLEPFPDALARGGVLALIGLLWVILVVRVVGLRSFSKMTAFDAIVTLAIGSLLATGASSSSWPAFIQAIIAIGVLLAAQFCIALALKASHRFEKGLQNEPLMLMQHGKFIEDAMRESRVSKSDVFAKLREANVLELSKVRAVVLETTGDISVLHGDNCDPVLLEGIRNT